jgi:hypothetical protein
LVLLPKNNSIEIDAPHTLLANVSKPLGERGYYVFPVAVIERFMRENGLHSGAQMHEIPLFKIQEHIAPDAVLYMTINQWGQKFQLLQSVAIVDADLTLVDARSGDVLWRHNAREIYNAGSSNSSSLTEMVLGAVLDQVAGSLTDHTDELSRQALEGAFASLPEGKLLRTSTRLRQ